MSTTRREFLGALGTATAYPLIARQTFAAANPTLGLIFPPENYPIPPDARMLFPSGVEFIGKRRADEQADQVRANPDPFQAFSAKLDHLAVRQHDLQAQDVIAGHPVLEAVGAARVEGHIPANGTDQLTGRVRRIIKIVGGDRL